jgi:Holliday junction resolvase RusA-like endonuclease
MSSLAICVFGAPAPQGSKRHLGKGVMVESSKKVKPWREAVKHAAVEVRGRMPAMTGPVHVTVCFTVAKPASAPKTRVTYPSKRPDLDKLLRSTFDALGDAGCWLDDGQVISVTAHKAYPNEAANALDTPGARIWITSA